MKLMRTEDAVGQVLCHDITQIIKGVTKDAVFRKGHVITEEDIPVLLSVGKDSIYIWEKDDGRKFFRRQVPGTDGAGRKEDYPGRIWGCGAADRPGSGCTGKK